MLTAGWGRRFLDTASSNKWGQSRHTVVYSVDPSLVLHCEKERRRVVDSYTKQNIFTVSGMGADHAGRPFLFYNADLLGAATKRVGL